MFCNLFVRIFIEKFDRKLRKRKVRVRVYTLRQNQKCMSDICSQLLIILVTKNEAVAVKYDRDKAGSESIQGISLQTE